MESASEKNAKMHAAARWRAEWRGFDEDRASERPREGGYVTAAEREASKEEQRREKSGGRADTNGNGEDGWRDASDEGERKSRERERARARGVRGRASERETGG